MEGKGCAREVGLGDSAALQVRDVMRARPKTLAGDATVGDFRRLFANPHVLTALLVDGSTFVGVLDRDGLDHEPDDAPDDAPARALARSEGMTISPEATVTDGDVKGGRYVFGVVDLVVQHCGSSDD